MKMKIPFGMEWVKKVSKTHLLIVGLLGILLLVLAIPTEEAETEQKVTEPGGGIKAVEETGTDSYKKSLERQLEDVLQTMEGVGKVEVMITMRDGGEAVVEKDITRTEDITLEEDNQGTKRESSVISAQEETIYRQGDSTDNEPFVTKELVPEVEGVLVVAQGGKNATVVKNISDAVLALFPVEVHKIKIVKMNE